VAAPCEVDAGAQGALRVADPRVEALQHDRAQRRQVRAVEQKLLLQLALACGATAMSALSRTVAVLHASSSH